MSGPVPLHAQERGIAVSLPFILSLAHHGLASEARSTGSTPGGTPLPSGSCRAGPGLGGTGSMGLMRLSIDLIFRSIVFPGPGECSR